MDVLTHASDVLVVPNGHSQSKTAQDHVEPILGVQSPSSPEHSAQTDAQTSKSRHFANLLSELTLEEKVSLLSGSSFTETTDIPRLGVPKLKVSDSINGVRGSQSHLEDKGTTCFPSTTCLASTWDKSLLHTFGNEVGLQARLKSVQVVLGPNVNLHRDPRGGRNFETFSEDPLLTGQLAASIVNGMQETGVGACAKHFVCNESETMRRSYDVSTSAASRTIRELYLKAFQHMLRLSNPVSIMAAYNKVDGTFCSQTPLIKEVLKNSWKYDGCIMSDWFGTRASSEALVAGLDLEMPGPSVFRGQKLLEEVNTGRITEGDIDLAARSVLSMVDKIIESYSTEPEQSIICDRTSDLARRVAAEGIVLLKNERNTLPLDMTRIKNIALIGDGASNPVITGGGSACAQPQYVKSMITCFQSRHPTALIRHAQGVNSKFCAPTIPANLLRTHNGSTGIDVAFFNDDVPEAVHKEILPEPQIVMLGRLRPGLRTTNFHFVITTSLAVQESSMYIFGVQVTGDFRLQIDGKEVLSGQIPRITPEDFLFVPKKSERTIETYLEAGKAYQVQLLVRGQKPMDNGEPTPHAAKLVLQKSFNDRQSIAEAVNIASTSDVSVIVAGRTHEHESEGFDLEDISMPESQVRLIKAISAVSERTVLVLHHGNPIDVSPVINDVDAILAAHFPGQEGATAITDIILGNTNPSGRLATTWPLRLDSECVPSFNNFPCTQDDNPSIQYDEGLRVGYRNPLAKTSSRFPFGHGLSYTQFQVSQLQIGQSPGQEEMSNTERTLTAQVLVHNSGSSSGYHVVQLYLEPPQSDTTAVNNGAEARPWRPSRELISFAKPYLAAGESTSVEMTFAEKDVTSTWDEQTLSWQPRPGVYRFVVADNAVAEASCYFDLDLRNVGEAWTGL